MCMEDITRELADSYCPYYEIFWNNNHNVEKSHCKELMPDDDKSPCKILIINITIQYKKTVLMINNFS